MPTLDKRHIKEMPVRALVDEEWGFKGTITNPPGFVIDTATMVISTGIGGTGTVIETPNITIEGGNVFYAEPAKITEEKEIYYRIELASDEGEEFRIEGKIYVTI